MMNIIPKGDKHGGAGCDDPHVRFCERPMNLFMGLLYYAGSNYEVYSSSQDKYQTGVIYPEFAGVDPFSTDKEYIEAVRKLHQEITQARPELPDDPYYDYSQYKQIQLVYELQNGRKLIRDYRVPLAGFEPELKAVIEAENYKYAENKVPQLDKAADSIRLNGGRSREAVIADPAEITEFKALLKQEILNMSYEEQTDNRPRAAGIEIMLSKEEYSEELDNRYASVANLSQYYELKPTYHELLNWLQAKGYAKRILTTADDVVSAEIVKPYRGQVSAGRSGYNGPDIYFNSAKEQHQSVVIKDKQQITAILKEQRNYNDRDGSYIVKLEFKKGDPDYVSLKAENLPPQLTGIMP